MPITSNGFYNDAAIGNSFSNIASMFAPPTLQDQVLAKTYAAQQAAAQAKATAIANLKDQYPKIGQQVADFFGAGSQDAVKDAGRAAQLETASANPANLSAQDALNYANQGTIAGTVANKQMEPLSADQTRFTPAAATGGPATTQYGVLKNGDRSTLLPNGQLPSMVGAPMPATGGDDDDAYGPIKAGLGLAPGVTRAPSGVTSIDAPDKPDTVDSQMAAYFGAHPDALAGYVKSKSQGDRGVTVNLDQKAPSKIEDAYGTAVGGGLADTIKAASLAPQTLAQIAQIRDAATRAGGNLTTGPFAQAALKGKQAIGGALGIEIPGTSEAEVINNIGYGLATQAARAIGSRPTQFEFAQALATKPGLALSPQGLQAVLNIKEQDAHDAVNLANLARDPAKRQDWLNTTQQYYADHPIMSPFVPGQPLGQRDVDVLNNAAGAGAAPTALPSGGGAQPASAPLGVGQSGNYNGAVVRRVR